MKASSIITGLLFCIAWAALTGCAAHNRVELYYEPTAISAAPCPKSLAVVALKDGRTKTAIGETQKGEAVYATSSVAEWISRALSEELGRGGCRVEYHDSEYAFNTAYTLTGEIKSVNVVQITYTRYDADMRLDIVLKSGDQRVFEKEYFSTFSKNTLPSKGVAEEVLNELLQGMMKEIVPEIRNQLR